MEKAVVSVLMHILLFGMLGVVLVAVGVILYQLRTRVKKTADALDSLKSDMDLIKKSLLKSGDSNT